MMVNGPISPRIRLVHGFNVSDGGQRSIGQLKKPLEELGYQVELVSYPWAFLLTLAAKNRKVVKYLVETTQPHDILVGHSNGNWINLQASEIHPEIKHLILVQPALHVRHEFPLHIHRADVYHNDADWAVLAGKWWRRASRLFPWRWRNPHGWGEMGRLGYLGQHPNVFNHDLGIPYGHSRIFNCVEGLEDIINTIKRHELLINSEKNEI